MFDNLSDRLTDVFNKLGSKGRLTESDVDAGLREVRMALLEADVNFKVVKSFVAKVREQAVGETVTKSLSPGQQVIKIVHDELVHLLGDANVPINESRSRETPTIIMLVGLQGAGKTTMAAKLALHLRKKGKTPLLVAADIYRPAAIKQLETLGKQLNIPVYSEGNTVAPPDIAERALRQARINGNNVVIVDTAGRLQIDERLMTELQEIQGRVQPNEVLLVVDAMIGQEAVTIAQTFNEKVQLTGLVMTKIDGDARGGAALSMREVTGVPIKFLGTGEKTDAIEPFHPDRLAQRILGMGDVMTLIEKAEQVYDRDEAKKMEKKLRKGKFDFEDFLKAMESMRKLGPLQQVLGMIPGIGKQIRQMKELEDAVNEKEMKRIEAIILSMTLKERRNPDLLANLNRKRRIAVGSGTRLEDVNALVKQFREMQRMMKKLGRGGNPNDLLKMLK
ncbi:MAG TPA: signal recognition particle protein [Herpetosiphonaceae bacterium]